MVFATLSLGTRRAHDTVINISSFIMFRQQLHMNLLHRVLPAAKTHVSPDELPTRGIARRDAARMRLIGAPTANMASVPPVTAYNSSQGLEVTNATFHLP